MASARALWSGALAFGLVHIPVKLHSASDDRGIDLDLLHKKDLEPIRYIRVCKTEGTEVPYRDIDPIYYEKPYYLTPAKGSSKAYALLREALHRSGKIGVARFVLRGKEHIAAVRAHEKMILLNQLRFESEIKSTRDLSFPDARVEGREMEMALALIHHLARPFRPEEFKDTYTSELLRVIEEKSQGKTPRAHGIVRRREPKKPQDLLKLLERSLEQEQREQTQV